MKKLLWALLLAPVLLAAQTLPSPALIGDNIVVQPGRGTTRLSLPNAVGAAFDVRAYGAKGDCTTDDAAAIQAAVNAAAATPQHGGRVYVPATSAGACYLVSVPITLPAGNTGDHFTKYVAIEGDGPGASTIRAGASMAAVILGNATWTRGDSIRDIGIDAHMLANYAIWQQNGAELFIDNVWALNGVLAHVRLDGGENRIMRSFLWGQDWVVGAYGSLPDYGLIVTGADHWIESNVIWGFQIAGINDTGGADNHYTSNHAFNYSELDAFPAGAYGSYSFQTKGGIWTGNTADSPVVAGFNIPSGSFAPQLINNYTIWLNVAPSGYSRLANVTTVTFPSGTKLPQIGTSVKVTGATDTSFNGTFAVLSQPSPTTITYANTGADASTTGGTLYKWVPSIGIQIASGVQQLAIIGNTANQIAAANQVVQSGTPGIGAVVRMNGGATTNYDRGVFQGLGQTVTPVEYTSVGAGMQGVGAFGYIGSFGWVNGNRTFALGNSCDDLFMTGLFLRCSKASSNWRGDSQVYSTIHTGWGSGSFNVLETGTGTPFAANEIRLNMNFDQVVWVSATMAVQCGGAPGQNGVYATEFALRADRTLNSIKFQDAAGANTTPTWTTKSQTSGWSATPNITLDPTNGAAYFGVASTTCPNGQNANVVVDIRALEAGNGVN